MASNGIVSVRYQQVSVGKHYGGSACDVLISAVTSVFSISLLNSHPRSDGWRSQDVG